VASFIFTIDSLFRMVVKEAEKSCFSSRLTFSQFYLEPSLTGLVLIVQLKVHELLLLLLVAGQHVCGGLPQGVTELQGDNEHSPFPLEILLPTPPKRLKLLHNLHHLLAAAFHLL
jgi:hypothetical protein